MVDSHASADELVAALNAYDVHFVSGGSIPASREYTPSRLLTELAQSEDARIRLAVIAILLRRPEFAMSLPSALQNLPPALQQVLKLYYTAAMLLQDEYRIKLERLLGAQPALPDFFSAELGVTRDGEVHDRLRQLGNQHARLSGLTINWTGTYEHAAKRLISRLEHEATWANAVAL